MLKYLQRFPTKANRFYFSQSFDEVQKAKRKQTVDEKQESNLQYKSFHTGIPYPFLKTLVTLSIPSLMWINALNQPYFSVEYAAGITIFFDNFCLLTVGLGGAAYATTIFSKISETQYKQSLNSLFLTSFPMILSSIGSTLISIDLSLLSFLFASLGQACVLYGVQKVQLQDWSIPWMFKMMIYINLFCFSGFLTVLIGIFALTNYEKTLQLKLIELQKLSDLYKKGQDIQQ